MKVWVITKGYEWGSYGNGKEVFAVVYDESKMIETIQKAEKENMNTLYKYYYEAVQIEV